MKITIELLKKKNACSYGKRWFKRAFPDGGDLLEVVQAIAGRKNVMSVSDIGWLLYEVAGRWKDYVVTVKEFDGAYISWYHKSGYWRRTTGLTQTQAYEQACEYKDN